MFCGDCCYSNNNSTEFNELFQIPQPFSLPHSLPQWPQGEGFATGRIRLGELELAKIIKFESVWNCQPSRRNVKGQIGYALVPIIARGVMLGADQPVILHMLDIPPGAEALNGVKMELADAAFSLLKGVVATTDVAEACKGVNVAVMVGVNVAGWCRSLSNLERGLMTCLWRAQLLKESKFQLLREIHQSIARS